MSGTKDKPSSTVLHIQRALIDGGATGSFYKEKRGLLDIQLGDASKPMGARTPEQTGKLLHYAAEKILSAAGVESVMTAMQKAAIEDSNSVADDQNRALLDRYAGVAAKHGIVSVPGLASRFEGIEASLVGSLVDLLQASVPAKSDDEITDRSVELMRQVYAFADAWHWLHSDVFGEHGLAFAKVQHKAGAAKGTQAVKDKKAMRNAIVIEQVNRLRASAADADNLTPATIARRIRVATLAAFKGAGLDHDYNDATFEKIVRRAL